MTEELVQLPDGSYTVVRRESLTAPARSPIPIPREYQERALVDTPDQVPILSMAELHQEVPGIDQQTFQISLSDDWRWEIEEAVRQQALSIVGIDASRQGSPSMPSTGMEAMQNAINQSAQYYGNNLVDEMEEDEEVIVEKPKRTRKPKVLPPFSVEKSGGQSKEIRAGRICTPRAEGYHNQDDLMLCPYTEYIPMDYLFLSIPNSTQWYSPFSYQIGYLNINQTIFNEPGRILEFINESVSHAINTNDTGNVVNNRLLANISDYITYDRRISYSDIYTGRVRINYHSFHSPEMSYYYSRSYSGIVGNLTLWGNCHGRMSPYVILATLPENYLYHKYHILLRGKIDLTKCFILIDRELDSTSFISKPFRAMFMKRMLPVIKELDVDIFKVPREFILKTCFVGNYTLEKKTIQGRRQEIEELITTFIKYGFNS